MMSADARLSAAKSAGRLRLKLGVACRGQMQRPQEIAKGAGAATGLRGFCRFGAIRGLAVFAVDDFAFVVAVGLLGVFRLGAARQNGFAILPVAAGDFGFSRWRGWADNWNHWLGRLHSGGLGYFLAHIGDLKPIGLAQRILSEARTDSHLVRRSFRIYCLSGCSEGLADGKGAEHD